VAFQHPAGNADEGHGKEAQNANPLPAFDFAILPPDCLCALYFSSSRQPRRKCHGKPERIRNLGNVSKSEVSVGRQHPAEPVMELCCSDAKHGCGDRHLVWVQEMRTEIARPKSSIRLSLRTFLPRTSPCSPMRRTRRATVQRAALTRSWGSCRQTLRTP
jgi:hypothetical protein